MAVGSVFTNSETSWSLQVAKFALDAAAAVVTAAKYSLDVANGVLEGAKQSLVVADGVLLAASGALAFAEAVVRSANLALDLASLALEGAKQVVSQKDIILGAAKFALRAAAAVVEQVIDSRLQCTSAIGENFALFCACCCWAPPIMVIGCVSRRLRWCFFRSGGYCCAPSLRESWVGDVDRKCLLCCNPLLHGTSPLTRRWLNACCAGTLSFTASARSRDGG